VTVVHHLDEFFALPTTSSLLASSDVSRVMATIAGINEEGTEYFRVMRELDLDGHQPPRGLTEAAIVESSPSFTSHGDLLFRAAKSNAVGEKPTTIGWLPASGDSAVSVASALGGVTAVVTAREAPVVVAYAPLPSADNLESGRRWRELRNGAGVTAILHSGYSDRDGDADLGLEEPQVFAPRLSDAVQPASVEMVEVPAEGLTHRSVLVHIEVATGKRWVIADEPDADLCSPVISPDCSAIAYARTTHATVSCVPHHGRQAAVAGRCRQRPGPVAQIADLGAGCFRTDCDRR
jgi:hypothetical protein